jgi:Fe-S cluster assembly protein SufB
MSGRVYLDWNATAPLRPEARAAMIAAFDVTGNPSSVHAEGRAVKMLVETAREDLAETIGCRAGEVVFTSGATEAAGMLAGVPAGYNVYVDPTAHDCLVAHWRMDGASERGHTLALGLANGETGAISEVPVKGADGYRYGARRADWLFLDVTQAVGRMPFAFGWSGADFACLSAHKLGGPKGVGALIVREGLDIQTLRPGGGQEKGRRSGTENVRSGTGCLGRGSQPARRARGAHPGRGAGHRHRRGRRGAAAEYVVPCNSGLERRNAGDADGPCGLCRVGRVGLFLGQGADEPGAEGDGLRRPGGRIGDPGLDRRLDDRGRDPALRRRLACPAGEIPGARCVRKIAEDMEKETKMALVTEQDVDLDLREGVDRETVETVRNMGAYKYGWETEIETEYAPIGVNEDIVRLISSKNGEPEWMTDWRLAAFRRWQGMEEPRWAMLRYPVIDYQSQYYYAQPKSMAEKPKSLDEVDPKLLATYEKLGIPLKEQMILAGVEGAEGAPSEGRKVAVDAVFDSVSVGTTFKAELAKAGVIFCSISEAIREHPELVRKYLGSVVPQSDNFFATLNSAVFSDGSFVYIPPGVRCPMELSTYFRINAENTGQFERTLIIADKGSFVSYLEGCTAPKRDIAQLHAAVVEIVVLEDAEVKYSTVQNWYPGDEQGRGGIYNFVTKRADCREARAKVMWTQVETGSAITWKYPSCILRGDDSQGEFYSIAIANNFQQADTGTKMIHLGKNTRSRIVSKGISAGKAQNTYRGLVSMHPKAKNSRNYTQCDSLLIGDKCGAHTVPYIEVKNNSSRVEHEATTSKVDDDQLFYCRSRGMDEEEAVALVVNGFCREVLQALPMEFAMEAQSLVAISLEGSVG